MQLQLTKHLILDHQESNHWQNMYRKMGPLQLYLKSSADPFFFLCRVFIDWMLVIDSILSICLYIVFIAESMQGVIYNLNGLGWDTRIYILLLLIPIVVIMQVRELKQLVPFTAVANMLIIASVGVSLYFIFSEPISLADRNMWPQWTTFPSFVR